MAEINQVSGSPVIDYMARDYESLLRAMRDQIPQTLPEWRDFANEADFGNVLLELFAHIGDILSYYQDRVANESFLGTARTRRSVIEHLRLIGYELGTAAPAAAALNLTVPDTVTATVTVGKGDAFATKSLQDRPSVRFEYARDVPLTIDFTAIPAGADGKRTFTGIPVEEGRLIRDEVLGTSDGRPGQRYPLVHPRVLLRPVGPTQEGGRDVVLRRGSAERRTHGHAVTRWPSAGPTSTTSSSRSTRTTGRRSCSATACSVPSRPGARSSRRPTESAAGRPAMFPPARSRPSSARHNSPCSAPRSSIPNPRPVGPNGRASNTRSSTPPACSARWDALSRPPITRRWRATSRAWRRYAPWPPVGTL